jgi:calmodulin
MGMISEEAQETTKDLLDAVKSLGSITTSGVTSVGTGLLSRVQKDREDEHQDHRDAVKKAEQQNRTFSRPAKKWIHAPLPYESREMKPGRSKMDSLFPFGKHGPTLFIFTVRSLHFITAILITIVLQWLVARVQEHNAAGIARAALALLPLLLAALLAPRTILPLIVVVTSIEQMKHGHDIRDTVIEMKAVQTLNIMRTLTVVHAQARHAMMLVRSAEGGRSTPVPDAADTPNTTADKKNLMRMSEMEKKAAAIIDGKAKKKKSFSAGSAKGGEKPPLQRQDSTSIHKEGVSKMGDLSKTQLAELRSAFNLFDKDRSGDIDKEEVGELLKTLGMRVTGEALDRLFTEMDVSNDGKVEFFEFVGYMVGNGFAVTDMATPKQMADYVFEIFDSDGGGEISSDELRQTLSDLQSSLDVSEVDEAMRMFDLDGSGKITKPEFVKALEAMNTFVTVAQRGSQGKSGEKKK